MFADILLPVPFESFTYSVPTEMEQGLCVGSRVLVELGKTKKYAGIVLRLHQSQPTGVQVKPILSVLDANPIVTNRQLSFWRWLADYYISPFGDVYKAAFPGSMKQEKEKTRPQPLPCRAGSNYSNNGALQFGFETLPPPSPLTPAQQEAYDSILKSVGDGSPITLLHGVTSSGKTEIYIHLIQRFLNEGKQVLYLLPEIALTTQTTQRLQRFFGDALGVYHSKFTDRQRTEVYMRQLSPQPYGLILGVRSSVFLPFQNLGLVIIDEEHETSYKQQEPAPRYHARSAAIMLARQYGAKTLLGTATPSLETYHLAQTGRYGYVSLTQRYADMQLPEIEVVDIARLRFQKRMKGAFSQQLIDAVQEALDRKEQVILFQNRRGFSSFLECKECGWVPRCQHCDVSLTFHKRQNQLVCHYCGAVYALPERCPACEEKDPQSQTVSLSGKFITKGTGTERIEEQISELFPSARISRMDLDTAKTRGQYQRIIDEFSDYQSDILIGTQMVSKGLDFDRVSVVGILDADTMLNQPDFRSYERTFHMLAQVAGRAGRKGHRGRVILQTRSADNPIIQHVVNNDYAAMYQEQMEERQLFRYPPFRRIIYVYLRHRDNDLLQHLADEHAALLRSVFGDRVLGPDTPPVGRISSFHIRKIILKIEPTASISSVRNSLLKLQQQLFTRPYATNLNVFYDVDPM